MLMQSYWACFGLYPSSCIIMLMTGHILCPFFSCVEYELHNSTSTYHCRCKLSYHVSLKLNFLHNTNTVSG
jgi:hypothetical protein